MLSPNETFYRKIGRRYVPVARWEPALMEAFPRGHHLVSVGLDPLGIRTMRRAVEPDHAGLLAALQERREECLKALLQAAEHRRAGYLTPRRQERHRRAWKAYCEVMGEDAEFVMSAVSLEQIFEALIGAVTRATEGEADAPK